jgi:ABC-type polysaccharide/polyol phosphate transport system ATPase subunit
MANPTILDDDIGPELAVGRRPAADAPVVIDVRNVHKVFRIPEQRIDTLKERVTHPLSRLSYRELAALKDISFDVRQGEFFGIAGRNGSGKSTLLKIMASIYRQDAGRVRMAGRVAPFIELGVGFNPELTARENCVLNGVLMGLTLREARRRLEAVLDFAELGEFVDLKLKNYSSGMMVRLAFAVMVQADADIMLIDEVLAVGDAAFAQKCNDVFHARRAAGKTVVLVTHDMTTVQELCDRAMLVHDGELVYIGDTEQTAMEYYRLNFAPVRSEEDGKEAVATVNARLIEANLRDEAGQAIENVEEGVPILLDALFEAAREIDNPIFVVQVLNVDGLIVFGFTRTLDARLVPGLRVRLAGEIENRLVPGRYHIDCWIRHHRERGDLAVQGLRLRDFVVYGTGSRRGVVSLSNSVMPALEESPGR